MRDQQKLAQVIGATGPARAFLGSSQGGEEQGSQNRNHSDNHQQLNQREGKRTVVDYATPERLPSR